MASRAWLRGLVTLCIGCGTSDLEVFGNATSGDEGATTSTAGTGGAGASGSGGSGGGSSPFPASCKQLPAGSDSGVYAIDPTGNSPDSPIDVYCDMQDDGGGWALVQSSVGDPNGMTTAFWNIPYAQRLGIKGEPNPEQLAYFGVLYPFVKEVRDVIVDVNGKPAIATIATTQAVDSATMHFVSPKFVTGSKPYFDQHVAAGWSSPDQDYDPEPANCAKTWQNVTQHYASCWVCSLGAAAVGDFSDEGWGPHCTLPILSGLGLAPASAAEATRVQRITRWARW